MQISINLWSIRDYFSTRDRAIGSLHKLKGMGFEAVELCHSPDMLSIETMVNLCSDMGLSVSGIHDITVTEDPDLAVARATMAQCKYVTFPYPAERDLTKIEVVKELSHDLNEAGKVLHQNDLHLTYHNHDLEFAFCGEARVIDILANHTSSEFVHFQFDVYWIKAAGLNPQHWCEKYSDRLTQLHLKDLTTYSQAQNVKSCPLGHGEIDWQSILTTVPNAQITIEQEHFHQDPFADFARSIHFLKTTLSKTLN